MILRSLVLAATLLISVTDFASATIVTGAFSGTFDSGTDGTGVFTTPGADLTGTALTGTFSYDTDQLAAATAGSTTTGVSSFAPTSLQFGLTVLGTTYRFTSGTNATVVVDSGPVSQITLVSNNNEQAGDTLFAETFSLDAYDLALAFITTSGLEPTFSASPAFTQGSVTIFQFDVLAGLQTYGAGGIFTISNLDVLTETDVPEPGSVILLVTALAGLAVTQRTRKWSAPLAVDRIKLLF